jgi:hypothetical protein
MPEIGLSEIELERIIMTSLEAMAVKAGQSKEPVKDLAGIIQQGLRNVARAIDKNNRAIAKQLQ